jgi:hypothetical protein
MVHMTEAEYEMLMARRAGRAVKTAKQPRVRGAKKTTRDGITFDSAKEANRWTELTLEERAGKITNLRRQVPFALVVNRINVANYVADFVYLRNGREVVEDSKGMRTEVYRLKAKLMRAVWGIEILET